VNGRTTRHLRQCRLAVRRLGGAHPCAGGTGWQPEDPRVACPGRRRGHV